MHDETIFCIYWLMKHLNVIFSVKKKIANRC